MHILNTIVACLQQQQRVVLCTVAKVIGSAPQGVGAQYLVYFQNKQNHLPTLNTKAIDHINNDAYAGIKTLGTIGGGHLEFDVQQKAAEWLQNYINPTEKKTNNKLLRYNLGASLGQCCGGVVWVALELITPQQLDIYQQMVCDLSNGITLIKTMSRIAVIFKQVTHQQDTTGQKQPFCLLTGLDENWKLTKTLLPITKQVCLFGAGHVGSCLAQLLDTNQIPYDWFDSRPEFCQPHHALNLINNKQMPKAHYSEFMQDEINTLDNHVMIIIMTHDHSLDYLLCKTALKQNRFKFIGLIGSQTKWIKFTQRLLNEGFSQTQIDLITCPIGISGINSKQPSHIAISIMAQILQLTT